MSLAEDDLTAIKSYKQIDPVGASHILCVFKRVSEVGYHNSLNSSIISYRIRNKHSICYWQRYKREKSDLQNTGEKCVKLNI